MRRAARNDTAGRILVTPAIHRGHILYDSYALENRSEILK